MADLIDNLCQATQIIVDKAIEELKFDKTVTGKIIDNSKANIGEYTVKEGVVEYIAYSENTSYKIGDYAFAEGSDTRASGGESHAEGHYTTASGNYSHAEGNRTTASGSQSHAEGSNTKASGNSSHAQGYYTKASRGYRSSRNCRKRSG